MRSHLRTIFVSVLAIGLLALFLRGVDFRQVGVEMGRARLDLLAFALAATGCTYFFRALRWQYLLRPVGRVRLSTAFRTTVIGFAASALLPARAGEFLRPYLLARKEGLSATSTFATVVLERLLDTLTVLLLFGSFLVLFDPGMEQADPAVFEAVQVGGLVAAVVAVAVLVVLAFLAGHPGTLLRVTQGAENLLPARVAAPAVRLIRTFAEGLAIIRQPRRLLWSLVLSFPLWLAIAAGIWGVSQAFHIDVPFTGSFLLMAMLVVGVAAPTPGAVGGFHWAFRLGATAFYGAPADRAVGAAIVLHAVSFVPVALAGILFLAQDGLSLSRMRAMLPAGEAGGAV